MHQPDRHPLFSEQAADGPREKLDTPIVVDEEQLDENVLVFRTPDGKQHIHVGMSRVTALADHMCGRSSASRIPPRNKYVIGVHGFPKTGRTQLARYVLPYALCKAPSTAFPTRSKPSPSSPRSIYIDCRRASHIGNAQDKMDFLGSFLGAGPRSLHKEEWSKHVEKAAKEVS